MPVQPFLQTHIRQLAVTQQHLWLCAATVVGCYGLAFSGGFTNALTAMDWNSYLRAEGGPIIYGDNEVPISAFGNPPNPLPQNVVEPSIGKYIGFMALIYFIGEHCLTSCACKQYPAFTLIMWTTESPLKNLATPTFVLSRGTLQRW